MAQLHALFAGPSFFCSQTVIARDRTYAIAIDVKILRHVSDEQPNLLPSFLSSPQMAITRRIIVRCSSLLNAVLWITIDITASGFLLAVHVLGSYG